MRQVGNYAWLYRLRSLLGIKEDAEQPIGKLSEDIMATFDVRELMADWEIRYVGPVSLVGAPGTYVTCFTVPVGELWQVHIIHTSTTVAASRVWIQDIYDCPVSASAAADTVSKFEYLWLHEGWRISREGTGNAGDGSESMTILVRRWKVN